MKTTKNPLLLLCLKSAFKLLLPVFVLFCIPAYADTISYTANGTFSASTPSSTFTAPGAVWSFSFDADANATVLSFGNGGFNFAFSNFSYSLDGSLVAITPTFIHFFSGTNGGGFEICFNGTTVGTCTDAVGDCSCFDPQMYTGTTSAPTLLQGAFTEGFVALIDSTLYDEGNTTIQATAVPEPSTLLIFTSGLLVLGVRHRYWRRF